MLANDAPEGKAFVRLRNVDPGRSSQMLQGMGLDGRQISDIKLSVYVRGKDIVRGRSESELPLVGVIFYDENRATIGNVWLGPWLGSFDWRLEKERLQVPLKTREAIFHIGLNGATGEFDIDQLEIHAVERKK